MYDWLKILDVFRLTGQRPEDDSQINDWHSLSLRFITEIQLTIEGRTPIVMAVDCFPLLYELINATAYISRDQDCNIYVGEGLEIKCSSMADSYNLQIGFELSEGRSPILQKQLLKHEALLLVSIKNAEIVSHLESLNVDIGFYLSRFPPKA